MAITIPERHTEAELEGKKPEVREALRSRRENQIGFELGQAFIHLTNGSSSNNKLIEGFIRGFLTGHRTLQQAAFSIIFGLIRWMAKCYKHGDYDGRNEATCKICAEIVDKVEGVSYERLPFI